MSSTVDSYGTLLAAMMTIAGVVWTVGFAAYELIFRHMENWAHDDERISERPNPAGDLTRYERVFEWFMIDGLLSFGAIVTAAAVWLSGDLVTLFVAAALFLGALILFFWLLTNEIRTTLDHVRRDRDRVMKLGKSGPDVFPQPGPPGRRPSLLRRLTAYGFLVAMYIWFGVQGGSGSGWVSTLQLGISAGSIAGLVVLILQTEVLRT